MITFFNLYEEYHREQLLAFVGSKQAQSGIIWGNDEPGCVIVTSGGKHGKRAGYGDRRNADGTWFYVGQGSVGDQDPNSYANSLLTKKQRTVLLFSTREVTYAERKARGTGSKLYRFEGVFEVLSWELVRETEGERIGNNLLVTHLVPVQNILGVINSSAGLESSKDLNKGQLKEDMTLYSSTFQGESRLKFSIEEYRYRSKLIKEYALNRAAGICERCSITAPFISSNGLPFLEVHHILRLADDGPDSPENVAALCPNCHREAHFGVGRDLIKLQLLKEIEIKEHS